MRRSAPPTEAEVLLLAKGPVAASNSWHAQGGVAAALAEDDEPELHAEDTFRAGRGLCRVSAVLALTEDAPARIADLVELGVDFDDDLGREGGHSLRRIAHVNGAETGKAIAAALAERVRVHPRITVAEGETVRSLWEEDGRCVGVVTDRRAISAPATLLATGGYAALWERTTNPAGAVGDGLMLAYRAGAALGDLEFVQFHPTALEAERLPALRGAARRGRGARRRRRRALHRRARAARRRHARDRRERRCAARPPRDRPRPVPGPDGDARTRRATTPRPSRFRFHRQRITPSAASSPTSTAARRCRGCTPPANAQRPACTAPTGSHRTRCSSASSSAAARLLRPCPNRTPAVCFRQGSDPLDSRSRKP